MPLSVMKCEATKIALGPSRLSPAVMSHQRHALTDKNPRPIEALNSNSRKVLGLYRKRPYEDPGFHGSVRALSIQRLEGNYGLSVLIGAGLRREVEQAGVVGPRSGCVGDGVGSLFEEPMGTALALRGKAWKKPARRRSSVHLSKHVNGSRLEVSCGILAWKWRGAELICAPESLSITPKMPPRTNPHF